jgi:peptidoglycan/xylan/chitin deacetylase (PgdA/CDA1 family)
MHGVHDVAAFERQLDQILRELVPVGLADVAAWLAGSRDLPDRAVWLTFDDGERSTLVEAAPILARRSVAATAFVCPGFVEGEALPWWEVVLGAIDAGFTVEVGGRRYRHRSVVTVLKSLPDDERREVVAGLPVTEAVANRPRSTLDDLRRWRDLGGDVGNHTWDHPCLDRCDEQQQRDQIDRAADWLDANELWDQRAFAYPNGNWSAPAEAHLLANGYQVLTLFDHRLAARRPVDHTVSRLRIDAGAPQERTRAITSGLHSGLFNLRERVRHVGGGRAPRGDVSTP